jgi:hypothetical protein
MRARGTEHAYPGTWLAVRLGVEPRELEIRRRAGELFAFPSADGRDYLYPAWQFDESGNPLPAVARIAQAARAAGLDSGELNDLLLRRDGITGTSRLIDHVRAGREERVLEAIRSTPRRG